MYTYADCPPQVPKSETEYSNADNPQVKGSANNNPATNEHGYCYAEKPRL